MGRASRSSTAVPGLAVATPQNRVEQPRARRGPRTHAYDLVVSRLGPILGINAFHGDSAACLVLDGDVVAAAEEERFRRIKHWAGFPSEAITYCLESAGLSLDQVAHIAVNRDPRVHLARKLAFVLRHRPGVQFLSERARAASTVSTIDSSFAERFPSTPLTAEVHNVEHHLAHLASAFYPSGYSEAAVVSIDGVGDFSSAAWGLGRDGRIDVHERVFFPHSLGLFYQALTAYLGFPHYGDEYKVMGLAPYGTPRYMDEMRQIVRLSARGKFTLDLRYFVHHKQVFGHEWNDAAPEPGPLYSKELLALLGPARSPDEPVEQRHSDIARSIQEMYEKALWHLLRHVAHQTQVESLVLTGGCAQNSVANGKIHTNTTFNEIYIPSAGGDAGGAIGAGLYVSETLAPGSTEAYQDTAYWGPGYSSESIEDLLQEHADVLGESGHHIRELAQRELVELVVDRLIGGGVVGWFQGRMEWGPRALGNRSILGDPRRSDMKAILNKKIKRREGFRPFAPSVLREAVTDWFESDADVPFMAKVFRIREDKRALIPAVTHVDGTGRLQTVTHESNPLYYRLIASFHDRTGVPMLLNTSFNESEPIVCRPKEALDCFLRTNMDVLVLGSTVIERLPSDGRAGR